MSPDGSFCVVSNHVNLLERLGVGHSVNEDFCCKTPMKHVMIIKQIDKIR